jgi:hypothetical protein
MSERWDAGQAVVQEGYNAATHKLIEVRPATVVEDSDRALVLYFAAGATYQSGDFMHGSRRYDRTLEERVAVYLDPTPLTFDERINPRHVVSILPPQAMHAIWIFWDRDWQLTNWYVNLQYPYVRAGGAIRIIDCYLDIAATPSLTWTLKDEDEFEAMCAHGPFTSNERDAIWAEAKRLAANIDARAWPFDGSWDTWRPSPPVRDTGRPAP